MWWTIQTVAAGRMSARPMGAAGLATVPVVIDSDDAYQRAIERVCSLRVDRSGTAGETELIALADAMLRWELDRHALGPLHD